MRTRKLGKNGKPRQPDFLFSLYTDKNRQHKCIVPSVHIFSWLNAHEIRCYSGKYAPVRSYLWCILQKLLQCQHSTATWNPPGQPWGFWFQSQLHWTWPSLQSELEIFVQGTRLADSVCCLISSFLVFNLSYQNEWFAAAGWGCPEQGMELAGEASSQGSSCSWIPSNWHACWARGDKTVAGEFGGGGGLMDGCLLIAGSGRITGIQYNALLRVRDSSRISLCRITGWVPHCNCQVILIVLAL